MRVRWFRAYHAQIQCHTHFTSNALRRGYSNTTTVQIVAQCCVDMWNILHTRGTFCIFTTVQCCVDMWNILHIYDTVIHCSVRDLKSRIVGHGSGRSVLYANRRIENQKHGHHKRQPIARTICQTYSTKSLKILTLIF